MHERFTRPQCIRYSCWSKILVNFTISYGGRVRLGLESPSTDPDVLLLGGSLLEPRRWAGSVRRYAISAKVWINCGGALGYCYLESIDKLWGWIWASWRRIAVIVGAATDVYVKSTSEYLWWQAASAWCPATDWSWGVISSVCIFCKVSQTYTLLMLYEAVRTVGMDTLSIFRH